MPSRPGATSSPGASAVQTDAGRDTSAVLSLKATYTFLSLLPRGNSTVLPLQQRRRSPCRNAARPNFLAAASSEDINSSVGMREPSNHDALMLQTRATGSLMTPSHTNQLQCCTSSM